MNQSTDQRRSDRRHANGLILVTDAMRDEPIGRVGNLSPSGLMLIGPRALREDALYQLRFQLPGTDGRLHTLEVGVHEQWTEAAAVPGQHWSGLRFVDISEGDAAVLKHWLGRN